MRKINLLNEIISVSDQELSQAFTSNKKFGITVNGEIKYAPFKPIDIFIYQSKVRLEAPTVLSVPQLKRKQELLGSNYQVLEEGERILINAGNAWQDIINYNIPNCHYDNTSGEGANEFADKEIEDMGWMLVDFDINYREIVEFLEENTDITLICIEHEEPYLSSSMGYFNNIEETQKIFYDFCQNVIKDKLANDPDYTFDYLDEDQREAVEFFKAK